MLTPRPSGCRCVSGDHELAYRLGQAAYRAAGSHSLPLDIPVMPCEEFHRRSRAPAALPVTMLREGRVLYAA